MADERTVQILDYELDSCPKCGKTHHYKLKVLVKPGAQEKVPLFGGPGGNSAQSDLLFSCPETNRKFTHPVANPAEGELAGLASEADVAQAAAKLQAAPPGNPEFTEWVTKSRERALDFCKTMLSTSTGAIPLYFAVLKYMGMEKVAGTALTQLAILPPVLYLVAAVLYVLALRPRYELVSQGEFHAFRQKRLEQLNRFILWGTALFLGATGLAILILFYALST